MITKKKIKRTRTQKNQNFRKEPNFWERTVIIDVSIESDNFALAEVVGIYTINTHKYINTYVLNHFQINITFTFKQNSIIIAANTLEKQQSPCIITTSWNPLKTAPTMPKISQAESESPTTSFGSIRPIAAPKKAPLILKMAIQF